MKRLALVALLAAGCTSQPFSMASLRIVGNSAFDETALRKAAGQCAAVEDCVSALDSHYFDHGYVNASVEPTKSVVQILTGEYSSLTVHEGKQFTIGALEIVEVGATDELGDPAQLTPLAVARVGQPFLREDMAATYAAVRARYRAAGYDALVVPITSVDPDAATIGFRIEVERGPLLRY